MDNIVAILRTQHRSIREGLAGVSDAGAEARPRLFAELMRAIATHESIDHIIVHPRVRRSVDGFGALADALSAEELSIRDACVGFDDLPSESNVFRRHLVDLGDLVDEHLRHEEDDEFPLLTGQLDDTENRRLVRAAEALSSLTATGSEAEYRHADLAAGSPNKMVGPFAAIFDRAHRFRDTSDGI